MRKNVGIICVLAHLAVCVAFAPHSIVTQQPRHCATTPGNACRRCPVAAGISHRSPLAGCPPREARRERACRHSTAVRASAGGDVRQGLLKVDVSPLCELKYVRMLSELCCESFYGVQVGVLGNTQMHKQNTRVYIYECMCIHRHINIYTYRCIYI